MRKLVHSDEIRSNHSKQIIGDTANISINAKPPVETVDDFVLQTLMRRIEVLEDELEEYRNGDYEDEGSYELGRRDGYQSGYEDGYSEGHSEGYDEGYGDGSNY